MDQDSPRGRPRKILLREGLVAILAGQRCIPAIYKRSMGHVARGWDSYKAAMGCHALERGDRVDFDASSRLVNSGLMGPNMKTLVLSIILLNVLDIILTLVILRGGGYELNPLIRSWLALGAPIGALMKIGMSAIIAFLMYRYRREHALKFNAIFIFGVCLFNSTNLVFA